MPTTNERARPVHEEVLHAVLRLCRARGGWTFTPEEIVRALPYLNESSVRTHIVSRCCVNAPKNHPHRWRYFRRVARGHYQVEPGYRKARKAEGVEYADASHVAETAMRYLRRPRRPLSDSIHVVVTHGDNYYVADCMEIAVVTQGRTLDELLANLKEAVALHLEGEDPSEFGLTEAPRLVITYETPALTDVV
jgi:predicted RNase H-like HicB family nuclease